jgi:hypothetical protein
MTRKPNRTLRLHVITTDEFIAQLKEITPKPQASAELYYLLCKAAIERRRREIEQCRKQGKDTLRLEQMVQRLDASMKAHWKLILSLRDHS